jgi:hypothetical protein
MGLLILTLKENYLLPLSKLKKNQENNLFKQNFLPFFWSLKKIKRKKKS